MTDQNSANEANYEELGNHIKLLSAQGKSGKLTERQVEDLEDYYERALQLRVIANSTLTEELKEAKQKISSQEALFLKIYNSFVWLSFVFIATMIYLSSLKWPDYIMPVMHIIYSLLLQPPILVLTTLIFSKKCLK